jgi:pilus assembly protein CpaB
VFSTLGRRRVAVVLFLALFAVWAVVALGIARGLQTRSDLPPAEPRASVVVATRDLPDRTRLGQSDIKLISVPVSARHPDAATALEQVLDPVLTRATFAAEPFLLGTLAAVGGGTGLALHVPTNMRAIAVSFSEVIGAGGLISPGDDVDVIAVFDERVRGAHEAGYVLMGVRVLAVAQSLPGTEDSSGAQDRGEADDRAPPAKTVTLAVTPVEAERLALAERIGALKLVLRAPGERDEPTVPPVTVNEIFLNETVPERSDAMPAVLRIEPLLHADGR